MSIPIFCLGRWVPVLVGGVGGKVGWGFDGDKKGYAVRTLLVLADN